MPDAVCGLGRTPAFAAAGVVEWLTVGAGEWLTVELGGVRGSGGARWPPRDRRLGVDTQGKAGETKRPFRTAVLLKICISRHDQQHGPGERERGDVLTQSEPSCRFLIRPLMYQYY